TKEEANDYRYFPDPDLQPICIDDEWRESIRKTLPELPDEKRARFISEYKLPTHDAEVLTADRNLAEYFEETVALFNEPKQVSNWVMGEVIRSLNEGSINVQDFSVSPSRLAEILELIRKGTVSGKIAKKVFDEMVQSGKSPGEIVEEQGLVQLSDESEITKLIDSVIASHPKEAEEYRGGKEKVFGFFVGQVMKASRGKANPGVVNGLLKKRLTSK
ncbi:MAG: Asp-tRNA(Asn)/Glu-tRNA(Gln) amidotransferase GatCAB subunit B, partial [Nitrospinota bacterium]